VFKRDGETADEHGGHQRTAQQAQKAVSALCAQSSQSCPSVSRRVNKLLHVKCKFTFLAGRMPESGADDNPKGVNPEHVRKIRQILSVMNAAQKVADVDVATFRCQSASKFDRALPHQKCY
jgi:hypothetical protein